MTTPPFPNLFSRATRFFVLTVDIESVVAIDDADDADDDDEFLNDFLCLLLDVA